MIQYYEYFNILIKPTEGCNLRCVYCFNKNNGYKHELMTMETLKHIYSIMFPFFKSISIVWHGGEPTFAGVEFYKAALELQEKFARKYNVKMRNTMQTNATLLNDEFIDLIENYHISLGISYDGIVNDTTRNSTHKVLSAISKLKERNIRPGIITVVSKQNIDKLIPTYEHFKELCTGVQFNHYIEMDKESPCLDLSLSADNYVNKMYELFLYWFNDTTCNIDLNPFRVYLEQYLFDISSVCIHASCMRSWMCVDHDGNLSACDKVFPKEYQYGNIEDYSDIREVYYSNGYRNLLNESVKRREKCIASCDYYKYCEGGCNHSALVEGDLENNGGFSCITFKSLFGKIVSYLKSINLHRGNIMEKINNPYLRKTLLAFLQNK